MSPPLIGGGIKRWCCLTSGVCLSRTSGLSREQRGLGRLKLAQRSSPRHTWLGHHFQGQKSRSPGRFTHRGFNAWSRCSGDHENELGVGNYCYVASARRRARRWGAHGGGEGRGISCRHVHSLFVWVLTVVHRPNCTTSHEHTNTSLVHYVITAQYNGVNGRRMQWRRWRMMMKMMITTMNNNINNSDVVWDRRSSDNTGLRPKNMSWSCRSFDVKHGLVTLVVVMTFKNSHRNI